MGEIYDIGLQTGKKLAKKVDAVIKQLHNSDEYGDNMDPINRKELDDSVVYRWNMKWQPHYYKDEQRLIAILDEYEDSKDEDYAYKLIAVGDSGGQDERGNDIGYELFEGLYNACEVTYPCDWDENIEGKYPYISFRSIDRNGDYQNWAFERNILLCWESLETPELDDPVVDIMMGENLIFPNDIKENFCFRDLLVLCGVKSPEYADIED